MKTKIYTVVDEKSRKWVACLDKGAAVGYATAANEGRFKRIGWTGKQFTILESIKTND